MKPIIGLTPSPSTTSFPHGTFTRQAIATTYVDAVVAAGGIPLILPPQENHAGAILDLLDGVLLTGGADVAPDRYGTSDLHPATYGVDPGRDQFELDLLAGAISSDIPTFCICRGIQVLNVAVGGTLIQDITDQHPASLEHRQQETGIAKEEPGHTVQLTPDGLAAELYGTTEIAVNSFHHQAIKHLADPLVAVGQAPDGIIEAVVMPGRRFILGVQWHPEMMFERHPEQLRPFSAFIHAAENAKR